MICLYHSKDLDGWCSGAIVKKKFPDCKLIGWDYGDPIPELPKDEEVIMIDISFPMKEMAKIAEDAKSFTWIDHHISAINDYMGAFPYKSSIIAVLDNSCSACEGGWTYFFPDKETPEAVRLLGEYDTWRKTDMARWENKIMPFQYGMKMLCSSPETFPATMLEDNNVETTMEIGKNIIEYQTEIDKLNCKKNSFERDFKGYKAICLNGGGLSSNTFKSVYDPTKHDLMMCFQYNGKFWTVSLYTTNPNIDCSALAKSMGGGGHRAAAGFQIEQKLHLI